MEWKKEKCNIGLQCQNCNSSITYKMFDKVKKVTNKKLKQTSKAITIKGIIRDFNHKFQGQKHCSNLSKALKQPKNRGINKGKTMLLEQQHQNKFNILNHLICLGEQAFLTNTM